MDLSLNIEITSLPIEYPYSAGDVARRLVRTQLTKWMREYSSGIQVMIIARFNSGSHSIYLPVLPIHVMIRKGALGLSGAETWRTWADEERSIMINNMTPASIFFVFTISNQQIRYIKVAFNSLFASPDFWMQLTRIGEGEPYCFLPAGTDTEKNNRITQGSWHAQFNPTMIVAVTRTSNFPAVYLEYITISWDLSQWSGVCLVVERVVKVYRVRCVAFPYRVGCQCNFRVGIFFSTHAIRFGHSVSSGIRLELELGSYDPNLTR